MVSDEYTPQTVISKQRIKISKQKMYQLNDV